MQRKTVTVLFCDVAGSTSLGDTTDPEALRALLAGYFERMKSILEGHGASVEKFIGDAVMAVFGVPHVHEDDALRACRAAVEMRAAFPEVGVQARIGVNTGEVVTGTEERLVTGDAVNVAARLEQAAGPGEILIGEPTFALVRAAAETEPVEPLELKGKSAAVAAYRLLDVGHSPERVHESAFVGRSRELETLHDAWQLVCTEQRCELVTVVGNAGVGKSRLTAELISDVDARSVRGRCLSYGEGISYFPVVEVLKQLDAFPSDPGAEASLRSLLGETGGGSSPDEIAWAFRKLLEEHAPLVCVFDDIQWGQETFLDLVEHVALLSGAPILLLCLGRPDFIERRPEWPVTLRLGPLPEAEAEELIPATLPGELRARIAHAAGGNPLFLTEMAAMADDTGADVLVPPNLHALVAARLDQLEEPERTVLERGAVEGEIFHRGAVQTLARDGTVVPRLAALVRKELIRPDRAQLPGDDAFRFRHLLVRDAAYDALPKASRAELHERFAAWLEERGASLVELDEIVGHHLEQAARYKRELGSEDRALSEQAGTKLTDAGVRALSRSDLQSALRLLERAVRLLRPIGAFVRVELKLAVAHRLSGDMATAAEIAQAAARRGEEEGDLVGAAVAHTVAAHARCLVSIEPDFDELATLARRARALAEEADDPDLLTHVWLVFAELEGLQMRFDGRAAAIEEAIRCTSRLGARPSHLFALGSALAGGSRPADEALATFDKLLPPSPAPDSQVQRARLLAMLGRFDEARDIMEAAAERHRELTGEDEAANVPRRSPFIAAAEIAEYEGDYETAAELLRLRCALLEEKEQWSYLSTYLPALGRDLCLLGRFDEAEPLAERGRELGVEEDIATQRIWRQTKALVLAHRGEYDEAERLACEAVELGAQSDALTQQGDTYCDLAQVLDAAGRTDEAVEALERALDAYARKKNLAMVSQVKPRLEELRARVS